MKRREVICRAVGGATGLAGVGALSSCETSESGPADPAPLPGRGKPEFEDEIGITTGGFDHQRERGELTLENLPDFLNSELGMRLIDVNTLWFTSFREAYVRACRDVASASGCVFTNLKVNHPIGDLYDKNVDLAALAMTEAQQMVDVAEQLGAKWVRFNLPQPETLIGDLSAHRQLAEYAAGKSVSLVVENGGWMRARADSIALGLAAIGDHAVAGPDTGNWNDEVRDSGLAQSFPQAATCDFKVFDLDADGRHAKYDLRRCFDIGHETGYRGPWLLEHWHEDTSALVRDLLLLRDQLRSWMSEVDPSRSRGWRR